MVTVAPVGNLQALINLAHMSLHCWRASASLEETNFNCVSTRTGVLHKHVTSLNRTAALLYAVPILCLVATSSSTEALSLKNDICIPLTALPITLL